jgi:hypothetical protein
MTEEKKEIKKKKLVYEQPRLAKLNGNVGAGTCGPGTSDVTCDAGSVAGEVCVTTGSIADQCEVFGNTAEAYCNTGGDGTPPAP